MTTTGSIGATRRSSAPPRVPTSAATTGYVGLSRRLSREQNADGKTLYYDYSANGEREGQAKAPSGQTDPTSYRSYGKDANGSVEELEERRRLDSGATTSTSTTPTAARRRSTTRGDPEGTLLSGGAGQPLPLRGLLLRLRRSDLRHAGAHLRAGDRPLPLPGPLASRRATWPFNPIR